MTNDNRTVSTDPAALDEARLRASIAAAVDGLRVAEAIAAEFSSH